MKLFYCDVLAPRKVCAYARHIGAPVEFVHVDLAKGENKTPAYLAMNPNGKVPVLVRNGRALWEADAILCDLAQATGSDLWPGNDRLTELVKWFSWNSQHFTRAGGALYFEYVIRPRFNLGPADLDAVEEARAEFRRYAEVLDDHLRGRRWLMGDRVTIADFSVAVTLPYAEVAHIPMLEYPEVHRWHDQLNQFDAWRDPWPEIPVRAVA